MEEQQFKIVSEKFYIGFNQFVFLNGQAGVKPPTTIPALITKLYEPAKDWGINNIEEYYPLEENLLNKDTGLSFEAEEFLHVMKNPEEYEQSIMRKVLIYCRENSLQEEYITIRGFLSNPDYSVVTRKKLLIFMSQITHEDLRKYVEDCYERVFNMSNYRVCPHCKWTLENKNGAWVCNYGSTCHEQAEFMNFSTFKETNEQYLRLKRGIHRYTLLPGIAEHNIAQKLGQSGYKVTMYPNIDEADLLIEKDGNTLIVDVKDHYHPFYFAKYITHEYEDKNVEDIWFVIPQPRLVKFPAYIKQARAYIEKEINVISESEFYRKVGDLLI